MGWTSRRLSVPVGLKWTGLWCFPKTLYSLSITPTIYGITRFLCWSWDSGWSVVLTGKGSCLGRDPLGILKVCFVCSKESKQEMSMGKQEVLQSPHFYTNIRSIPPYCASAGSLPVRAYYRAAVLSVHKHVFKTLRYTWINLKCPT